MISGRYTAVARRGILMFVVSILTAFNSHASHVVGTELTYRYQGGNQYEVTYTLYRDCGGSTAPLSANLIVKSASCNVFFQQAIAQVNGTGQETVFNCSGSTTCNGGTLAGVQEYVYRGVVSLPVNCPDYKFSVSDCCRNAAITNLARPETQAVYTEAFLNNVNGNNSSPQFTIQPITTFCKNQPLHFNPSAIENDGDSLVYSLSPAMIGEGMSVNYTTGYSYDQPVSSLLPMTIDAKTGDITVTPSEAEVSVVHFTVQEYRQGILIGQIHRDVQLMIVNCTNAIPTLSGINGTSEHTIEVCATTPLSLFFNAFDSDANQSVSLTGNSAIPAANFHTEGNTIFFQWNPDSSAIRSAAYNFTITVNDQACPVNGVQTYTFSVYVTAGFEANVVTTPTACNGISTGSASVQTGSTTSFRYQWSSGNMNAATVSGLAAGTYTVTIDNQHGCLQTKEFTIENAYSPAVSIEQLFPSLCSNEGSGSVRVAVSNVVQPVQYSWNNGMQTAQIDSLLPGNYSVIIRDANGCAALLVATIPYLHAAPSAYILGDDQFCKGQSLSLKGVGGSSFSWSTGARDERISVNEKGTVSLTVTDQFGCRATASKEIYEMDCDQPQTEFSISTHESFFTLHFLHVMENHLLLVFNAAGQLIEEKQISTQTSELSVMPDSHGVYLVQLIGTNGTLTKKVMY